MGVQDQQSDFISSYGSSGQLGVDQALFDEWRMRVDKGEELGVHFDQSYQDRVNAAAARINAYNEYQAAQAQRAEQDVQAKMWNADLNQAVAGVNEGLRAKEEATKLSALQGYKGDQVQQAGGDIQMEMLNATLNQALATAKPAVAPYDNDGEPQRGQQTVRMFIGGTDYGEVPAQITYAPQFKFSDFSTYIPEKSPLDDVFDQIKSGAITASDLLDVRKYLLPVAAQTVMNSDVLMTGLLDKFKSNNTASQGARQATEEIGHVGKNITEILKNNKIKGDAYEKQLFEKANQTLSNPRQQVTIQTESGVRTRVDILGIDKETGKIQIIEAKSSPTAPLTKNQKASFPEIEETGATVLGKGKDPYVGGTQIPPTKVEIIRPLDDWWED